MVHIPRVRAQTLLNTLSSGRNKPLLMTCIDQDSEHREYVVKSRQQLGYRVICEVLAALLGHHLGLPIPPIAIVEIPVQLSALLHSNPESFLPGAHFGSQHVSGGQAVPTFNVPVETAIDVFAFDMLIQNPDRSNNANWGKPNILYDGQQVVLFDHELAFSFLSDLGTSPDPWRLRALPFSSHHIFFGQIRAHARDHNDIFAHFLTKLSTLSEPLLQDLAQSIPNDWQDASKSDKIILHLVRVCENISLFKHGLLEVLA